MSDDNVLQNLRDCTVQIRAAGGKDILGTGIAVSMDGRVVTCAHVVEGVLGEHPHDAGGAEVGVYFPQARGGEVKARRATVAGCFAQHDDDVVLLQLVDGPAPLAPEQIAVLGRAEDSCYHSFRSYGYRRLDNYIAGHAHGTILDCVPPPEGSQVLAEPVQLQSQQINCGMSGAPVLDVERNLIVGVVSETWFPPADSPKDRDTAWAVNARVLSLAPLGLPLRDEPLAKRPAPQPKTDVAAARAAAAARPGVAWNNAPPLLEEWTGRAELLAALDRDWADPERRVSGLIGFGGEGKSSLARRWVENLLGPHPSPPPSGTGEGAAPDGVFWWGFYERPGVDEFFEAALDFMSGGRIDPRRLPGASLRAQVIAAMLGAGRYLFVLDGLEVLQRQEGDDYGLLRSADLRDFLALFAAPGHTSFCLVTSRAPLLDLMAFTSYRHRNVTRLSAGDGAALLGKLGVTGPDAALARVVADWDGHALTLGLLGSYLVERCGGDVSKIGDLPPPTADVGAQHVAPPQYARVHRVLRRYDEHLNDAERAFLRLFSAFRTPVGRAAFDKVFRAPVGAGARSTAPLHAPVGAGARSTAPLHAVGAGARSTAPLHAPLAALDDAAFAALLARLEKYRLLRRDARDETYTAHPLVRAHYFALLTAGERAAQQDAHARIKDYYLEVAGDTPRCPTLEDLAPLIEVVHHTCRAGAYDEAFDVVWGRIYQRTSQVIIHQLGAYETNLALMREFFPGGATSQEPQVSDPRAKSFILNEAGLCLMSLGRLSEAAPFFERKTAMQLEYEDWSNASIGYRNLAELHAQLGVLAAAAAAAGEALALARRAANKQGEMISLDRKAWTAHLRGDLEAAEATFKRGEELGQEIDPTKKYRYSLDGIHHAEHLRRAGDAAYARRVTEANLEICQQYRFVKDVSMCHRVLGDLDAGAGQHESAAAHYAPALEIARGISHRPALIEALLARGRWAARDLPACGDRSGLAQAFADLNEALGYALDGGYRIYEADVRVALAWAHLAAGDAARAQAEAARARAMSREMGYHWGQVDVEEVLGVKREE